MTNSAKLKGGEYMSEEEKAIIKSICKHCFTCVETTRDYYENCSIYNEDCDCQCLQRKAIHQN